MIIKPERIITCSSEHPDFPASNLLKSPPPGPWKCEKPGLLLTNLIFQLPEESCITGLDIGNYRSCIVIVTASTSSEPDNWTPIVNHQFLTHDEAANNKFKDQVQLFTKKELNPETLKIKFTRVKITCMQSANLKELFGLSFIVLRTEVVLDMNIDVFGRFKMKKPEEKRSEFKEKYLRLFPGKKVDYKEEIKEKMREDGLRNFNKRQEEGREPRKRPLLEKLENGRGDEVFGKNEGKGGIKGDGVKRTPFGDLVEERGKGQKRGESPSTSRKRSSDDDDDGGGGEKKVVKKGRNEGIEKKKLSRSLVGDGEKGGGGKKGPGVLDDADANDDDDEGEKGGKKGKKRGINKEQLSTSLFGDGKGGKRRSSFFNDDDDDDDEEKGAKKGKKEEKKTQLSTNLFGDEKKGKGVKKGSSFLDDDDDDDDEDEKVAKKREKMESKKQLSRSSLDDEKKGKGTKKRSSSLADDDDDADDDGKCAVCIGESQDRPCKNCGRLPKQKAVELPKKKPKVEEKMKKPFSKLLDDVSFSLSGYVNPQRDEIRRKAIKMGAKYIADPNTTTNKCTHLICAFRNTPKSQQLKGHAKILSHLFIEECFDHEKRYPWRRYAIEKSERKQPESEDEIEASKSPVRAPNPFDQDTDLDSDCDY